MSSIRKVFLPKVLYFHNVSNTTYFVACPGYVEYKFYLYINMQLSSIKKHLSKVFSELVLTNIRQLDEHFYDDLDYLGVDIFLIPTAQIDTYKIFNSYIILDNKIHVERFHLQSASSMNIDKGFTYIVDHIELINTDVESVIHLIQ